MADESRGGTQFGGCGLRGGKWKEGGEGGILWWMVKERASKGERLK